MATTEKAAIVRDVRARYGRIASASLAAARDEDVLSEWAGLGYYARARNLVACARQVADMGSFPMASEELRKLPGIGAYTSAVIAAIAFGEPAAAVDTNIGRVISRYYGLANPGHAELERHMAAIVVLGPPGDIVQAMMDLGATICQLAKPRCEACPLNAGCQALASGVPQEFPSRKARAVRPQRSELLTGSSEPEFLPIYERMAAYNLPVWIHAARLSSTPDYETEKESRYNIYLAFGWPYESSLCLARLVCSGLLDKSPDLKIVSHHGGAMIPFFSGRLAQLRMKDTTEKPFSQKPVEYFKKIYADTAIYGNTPGLMCAHSIFGADKMLFGTDMPDGPGFGEYFIRQTLEAVDKMNIPETDKNKI